MIYMNVIPTSSLPRLVGFFLLLHQLSPYQQVEQEPAKWWNKGCQQHEYEDNVK